MYYERRTQTSPEGSKEVPSIIDQEEQRCAYYGDETMVYPHKVRHEWEYPIQVS